MYKSCQPASIDTHNGMINGPVMRVDPAVLNGTVTVDVKLTDAPPQVRAGSERGRHHRPGAAFERALRRTSGLRPGKQYRGHVQARSRRKGASRMQVELGRSSVTAMEISVD